MPTTRAIAGLKANRNGSGFERQIEEYLTMLQASGIAFIQKTPEPMRPISGLNRNGACTAVYTKKAQPDFKGVLHGGRCVIFEAKHCQGNSVTFSRVQPEQMRMLEAYQKFGAMAFIWVGFSDGGIGRGYDYAIPFEDWCALPDRLGKKSANRIDLQDYDVTEFVRLSAFFNKHIKKTINKSNK